jgi:hypothetical protein
LPILRDATLRVAPQDEVGVKKHTVTPGNWKTMTEKPFGIGIEAFSNPWKIDGKDGKQKPARAR